MVFRTEENNEKYLLPFHKANKSLKPKYINLQSHMNHIMKKIK